MFLPVEVSLSRLMPFDKTPLLTGCFYFPWFSDSLRLSFCGILMEPEKIYEKLFHLGIGFCRVSRSFLRNLENVLFSLSFSLFFRKTFLIWFIIREALLPRFYSLYKASESLGSRLMHWFHFGIELTWMINEREWRMVLPWGQRERWM